MLKEHPMLKGSDYTKTEELSKRLKEQIRQELQNRRQIEENELNQCIHQAIEAEAAHTYLPLKKKIRIKNPII